MSRPNDQPPNDWLAMLPLGRLARCRGSACVQASGGAQVTAGLPTPNSEALASLYEEGRAWLLAQAGSNHGV